MNRRRLTFVEEDREHVAANLIAAGQHVERASVLVRRETLRMGLGAANELAWLGSIDSDYRRDSRAGALLSAA